MVENFFDNRFALTFDEAKNLLDILFSKHLPNFKLGKIKNYGMSFTIIYKYNETVVSFSSEKGYLSYMLLHKNEKVDLKIYDYKVSFIEVTSKKNLIFLIDVLKSYFKRANNEI